MSRLRVHALTMSLDGYVAGPDQSLDTPLGVGGERLHEWMFQTRTWHEMVGEPGGARAWTSASRRSGYRGHRRHDHGPQHVRPGPRRVVASEAGAAGGVRTRRTTTRCSCSRTTRTSRIEMEGGTTFLFVTDGIESALDQARAAAGSDDIRLGGGAATVRSTCARGLVDDLHVAISPVLLGAGERLFDDDLGDAVRGYECVEMTAGEGATHVRLTPTLRASRAEDPQ